MKRTALTVGLTLTLTVMRGVTGTEVVHAQQPPKKQPLKIAVTLSNPQQLKLNFPIVGAEKHRASYVKREGVVDPGSTWAGAKVEEVALHDVFPGDRVWGAGYITFTMPNGDHVSMKQEFAAIFLPKAGGKMKPSRYGTWTIIGGTGKLAGIRGVGHLRFWRTPKDPKARVWELTGDFAVLGKQ